jgi:hypothetical protein
VVKGLLEGTQAVHTRKRGKGQELFVTTSIRSRDWR